MMNRPYTVCYLNCSADGHIDGEFFRSEEIGRTIDIFRSRWLAYNADATVYGAVTMRMFAAGSYSGEKGVPAASCTDYRSDAQAEKYYIAIDPEGTVAYTSPYIDVRGRGKHGVIHAVTANTSEAYLAYLREQGISYIFCGTDRLDPVIMMKKAYAMFGVKKAILSGGAYADWTMLSAGLVDELTLMFSPVVDGNPTAHSVFMRSTGMAPEPVGMELINLERTEGDAFFVTYRPKNALPNA